MDVPPGEDSTLPSKDIPPGWARIELEPVNIPLEQNESILLSSVQSVIPGAHGLYYKEDNRKRALKYDSTTGCILKGPPGWNSKPIYVVLAHGCRYFNSIAVGQYDAATERFEKTANFIQRILTDRNAPSYLHRKDISNRSTDRKGIGDRLSRNAQIGGNGDRENRADEEEQIDGSFAFGKSSKTSIDIQKPQEENDISKQSDLRIHPSTYNIGKEERARSEDVCEKLKRQKEKAENELIEKERKVNDLEQIISDLELKLNEHKQSSDVTQARVKDLEIMLDDERNKAQSLANLNAELNTKIENFSLAQQSDIENDRLKLSREELDKKNYEIDNLNMQINDLKWSLGEHKQWLKDANDRANHFENMCKEKDYIIDDLTNRLHGAERRIVEIPIPKNTENLNSLIDDLRNQIDKKNNYIDQLEKTKNEAQWHLGEHQHWLQDANNRIDVLENEKSEVWRKVRELEERLHQVEPVAAAVDYNQTKAKMEELQQTMKNKNREYEKLNEQKNEMDVNLGEHKVWLEDAKKRIKYLEDEGTENDHFILDINKELGELKEVRIDAFQQLHEKIDDLEFCLSKKINESEFGNDNLEYKQLKRSVKDLGRNISDENIDLNNLSKLKNNGECNFEEQWLQDLKNRITELESAIQRLTNEKNAAISKLNEIEQLETNMEEINKRMLEKDQLIVQLEKKVNDKQNELNSFGWRIEELLRELNEANKNLKNCEQQKNDTEWSLGEHRQWLTDAKNKIDEIENKLEKISGENNKLREEIEELNRASVEATEGLQKEINDKNEQLNCITKQKNDAEWSFGEHRQWLKDANNRISELESALTEKNRFIEEMQKYNEEHSASGELIALQEKLQAAEKALDEAPKQEKMNELSSLVDHLQNELSNKNECIKNLEKQCNDAEWSLGEHRQWIHDSSNRIQDLEEELHKNGDCIKQLEREIGNQSAEISNYLATIDALNNELTGKNVCIGDFEKAKNNAEWSLGEHRQWLQNANNRIDELAHSIEDKDREIAELRKAIEDFSHLTTVDKESLENLKSKLHETEEALAKAPKPDEISALKSTIEQLRNDLDSKNVHINDLEWNFGEQRQRLQDANERIAQLEKSLITKDEIIKELRNEIDELSKKVVLDLKAALEAVQMQVQPEKAEVSVEQLMFKLQNAEQALAEYSKLDDSVSLKTENENLKELLKEKNEYIDNLVQQRNNAEWSLGEHRQWLQDCNKRANWLDDIVMIKNNEIDELRCENDRLKFDLNKVSQHGDINNLIATIENLHNEISNKNNVIDEIMKQRNEAEWKLGEHRQWLEDAKNRADQLAGKLIEKEQFLNLLLEKYPEIMKEGQNKINVALVRSEPVESDKNKLFEKIFELEEKLLETEIPAKSYEESMLKTEHEATIAKLRDDLDQKDDDLARVHKERSDAEWFLGEERQRLKDANHRIAVLEEELMHEKTKHADMLQSLKNEVFELSEKNKKLKEILAKTEVLMRNLSKDSKMTMLILEQTEGPGNLEEEFKQLCNKYVQLSALLTTTQEHLAKLQTGASEFANYEDLRKVIENLNNELHQCKAENKNLMKQKNNAEWQLGEHREWLRNANNRITVLEEELMRMEEAEKRAHEVLRLENEALNQTNTQLKEDMKHLQDEIQGLLLDAKEKFEEHICCACNEVSAVNRTGNSGEDLSAMSRLLENLLGELNHQKIIDNLMEQRSKAERLLEDRKETITDVYDKIVELEKQILENTLEEPLEITEIKTVSTRIDEEDEKVFQAKYVEPEKSIGSQEVDEIQRQLDEKKVEVENLMKLKSELERNLEEVIIRNKEMSTLLDKREATINAIINEKNAIAVERDALEQQVVNLKQRCHSLSPLGMEIRAEDQNATELMVRLCEKEDQLQQVTTEIAEKAQEITNLHDVIRDLRDVINEKNRIIDDLNRITSEKEWNLGEHRQWLFDANISIKNLEAELSNIREEVNSNKMELDRLNTELDEKNGNISQLHNKIAELESEAINMQYGKELSPNQDIEALQEKLSHLEEYVQFQNEELQQLKKEQAQMLVNEQSDLSPTNAAIRHPGMDGGVISEEYHELSSELITLNRRKYELEEKMKRMENELYESYEKMKSLEDEQRKTGEEIWLAKERVANQDRELENLHGQCSWLRDENARLQNELGEERKRNIENGGVDWSKFDEMKNEMKQIENILRDEKSKVEWRLGEVTQYWNDAKWKIGELEAGMAHKEWLLDQAQQKIYELDQMYRFRDTTKNALDGTFLIKKQPTGDRYKWRLAMWNESSPEDLKDYRRIWFEIRAPTSKIVLLSASFVNWECFLLCQKLENDADKFGVWVDIPPGRYEFVFIVDGNWTTSENYATCWNEHGTHNNWRNVD